MNSKLVGFYQANGFLFTPATCYNDYNDYNDYNNYNDYNDYSDYSDYNDYRDSDLDLD